jgi:hypothetical protein
MSDTDDFSIWTSDTKRLTVKDNGNVGIGTDSPSSLLTVDSNAPATTSDSISVKNRGITATGHTVGLRFQYNTAVPSAIRTVNTNISSGAGRLGLFTSPDGTANNLNEWVTILPAGNVGIGTTNPGEKLEVTGNTSGNWISLIENTHTTNGFGLKVKAGDNNDVESFRVANIANDNLFNVKAAGEVNVNQGRFNVTTNQNANFVAKFINNAGGGYGIGMDMAAGNHFFFYRSGSGTGSITDNGSNVSYNTSSDYRLKENIVDLDGSVDRLKQLQPRRFNFIGNDELGVIDGFIAHEVQAVIPDAVQGEKDAVGADGNIVPQAIDQSRLVPLLTAALQEALIKIEQLEARVDELENK